MFKKFCERPTEVLAAQFTRESLPALIWALLDGTTRDAPYATSVEMRYDGTLIVDEFGHGRLAFEIDDWIVIAPSEQRLYRVTARDFAARYVSAADPWPTESGG